MRRLSTVEEVQTRLRRDEVDHVGPKSLFERRDLVADAAYALEVVPEQSAVKVEARDVNALVLTLVRERPLAVTSHDVKLVPAPHQRVDERHARDLHAPDVGPKALRPIEDSHRLGSFQQGLDGPRDLGQVGADIEVVAARPPHDRGHIRER